MNRHLTKTEIDYVWMHFEHHYMIGEDLKGQFEYISKIENPHSPSQLKDHQPGIYFPLSDQAAPPTPFYDSQGNLVLFPLSVENQPYCSEEGKLEFQHDYLKTIFYFISGYQEWQNKDLDQYGRFQYKSSIQAQYNIRPLPFVNDIMQTLAKGLSIYAQKHGLTFKKRPPFRDGVFLLSHDIDHIHQYRLSYIKYKLKEIAGLVKNPKFTRTQLIDQLINAVRSIVTKDQDPSWSFDFLQAVNQEYKTKATYFFLTKEGTKDASYDLHSELIRELIRNIENEGNEIAVHGTLASHEKTSSANTNFQMVQEVSTRKIQGIRQHWLAYKFPITTKIHQDLGYQYDATLGFNDRPGFRHGYCFPFKLWDFDAQEPFDIWEIPLCVMDVTLLSYMGLSIDECEKEIKTWLDIAKKQQGVFSLLWHNSTLDEKEIPGVRHTYDKIIKLISSTLEVKTHAEIADLMEKINGYD